jgi:hypothetical protein
MDATGNQRPPVHVPAAKARPDARPMRMALGAGGLAALSAIVTAIVLPPRPTTSTAVTTHDQAPTTVQPATRTAAVAPTSDSTTIQVRRAIRYVQLQPGQTAPPGAQVIEASAPTPITLVVTVRAPAQPVSAPQQPVAAAPPPPAPVTTTQSGKVGP